MTKHGACNTLWIARSKVGVGGQVAGWIAGYTRMYGKENGRTEGRSGQASHGRNG